MPSTIVCPQCGLKMRVYRGAGTKIDCPSCRKSLKIVRPGQTRASAAKNQRPPSTHDWYYRVMGVEVGPLSLEALRRDFELEEIEPRALLPPPGTGPLQLGYIDSHSQRAFRLIEVMYNAYRKNNVKAVFER